MSQANVTKYIGATNFKQVRVRARCQAGSIIINWDDGLDIHGNHDAAAKALASKLGWSGRWVGGGMPDGSGNCYVLLNVGITKHSFKVSRY